jgi:drug/metabolite transporter (DMT)-like permease
MPPLFLALSARTLLMHSSNDKPLFGILAMLLAVFMFSGMDASMKALTAHYGPMQITCLRATCAWPFIVLWLWRDNRLQHLMQARWSLHLFRAVLGIIMLSAFIFALKTLSLADAYAIFFAAPLLITMLSVWWLKDYVAPRQWVAILIGMAAVLYMLKPDGDQLLSLGALAALLSAFCYAVSGITVRILAKTEPSGNMVFWLMTMIGIGAGLLALPDWQPLQLAHWPYFLAIGITGAIGQVFITEAFRLAPPSVIAPFEYSALVWGLGFDIVLWQVWPDSSLLLGASVIMASGLYLIWQERR